MRQTAIALWVVLAACGNDVTGVRDGAAADFLVTVDLPGRVDFAVPADQSSGNVDMAVPVDLTQRSDFALPRDLTPPLDLTALSDLTVAPDLTAPSDLIVLPDLLALPDLTILPDLLALPDLSPPPPDLRAPTIIDFEDRGDGPLAVNYRGLTWEADWYAYHPLVNEYNAHSGSRFVTNLNQPNKISFSFPSPVYFVGAWFSLAEYRMAHVRFDVYDAQGVLIKSSPTLLQTLAPQFLSADAANVTKVSVVFDVDFAMDDVTYYP